ncbi:MAG: nucleotidyltransferase domain-containing protein [archaeon]|nr:nucleotidyltransferase domain-containing protein [archaeon]
MPELKSFCDAVILAGSVAYGKNFSVRKESDIDLIILIERKDYDKITKCKLFKITAQIEEALEFFKNKEVDHFSIREKIDDVDIQYHFWDKEAHYRAELMQLPAPKVYNVFNMNPTELTGLDFSGIVHHLKLGDIKKCKYGAIHNYPAYFMENGYLILRQPILNLITAPEILFTKDSQLLKNIESIWQNLAKKLIEESNGKVDLSKKSIIRAMYGNWNLSEESKKILEEKQKMVLSRLGVQV